MSLGFDGNNPALLYLFMGVLMLPNAVSQAVTALHNQHPAPMWSFHLSLIMNAGYSCLIYYSVGEDVDSGFKTGGIILLSIAVLAMIIPLDKCCWKSFQGNHFVFYELFHGFLDKKRFQELVERNRAAPPVVTVTVTASHRKRFFEPPRNRSSRKHTGRLSNDDRVITWRDKREFMYTTWEEEGNSVRLDDKPSVIHALFYVNYRMDSTGKMALESFMDSLYAEGLQHDRDVEVDYHLSTPDLVTVACGTFGSDRNPIVNFYGSWYGRGLWFLAWILGYQSLFECIWSSTGERMRIKLVKNMSMGPGLRAKRGHPDHIAARQAVRQGPVGPIIGPSAPVNTPYAPPSETVVLPPEDYYPPFDSSDMPRRRSRPRNTTYDERVERPMVISTDRLWTHMPE